MEFFGLDTNTRGVIRGKCLLSRAKAFVRIGIEEFGVCNCFDQLIPDYTVG